MDFWGRLKDEIRDRDLSQEAVARRLKIPVGTFKNWLLRHTYPDAREAVEIARLLNTTVEQLVNGNDRYGMTEDERRLLDGYRKLSKYDREHIATVVDVWNRRFKDK